ncbi:MAG: TolC family outer membrane protein [Gammaproteobacteria bacterium]
MRLYPILFCALLLAPATTRANELLKVYELARGNDTQLQAAAHARDAALQARPQARAAFLPQVSAGYQETRSDDELTTLNGQPCDAFGNSTCTFENESDGLQVTLNQALFDWRAIQTLRQSGDQVRLAQINYRGAEQNLVLRTAEAYFNLLSAADDLRSAQAENKAVERQLEQSQKRFEVGLSAITDIQEAQARYDLTVAQVIEAEQALRSAGEALQEITGAALVNIVPLQEDFPLPAPDPADVNAWVGAARDHNLSLQAAAFSASAARKGVEVARADHFPTVGAQAQYSDGSQGGRFAAEQKSESLTLQLNLPIFSGGATQSRVNQARSLYEQREAEREGIRRQVERQARDAYQGVISGAARVKALKQAVLSNRTALEASETGLQVGTRTAVDVLNTQQQLYLAERNYSRARYDYLLSVLRLKAAAGRLGESDLQQVDQLLVAG